MPSRYKGRVRVLTVRIPLKLHNELTALSGSRWKSKSDMVRDALYLMLTKLQQEIVSVNPTERVQKSVEDHG